MNLKALSFKRIATTALFVFSIIIAQFATVQFASAASLTWDGSAGDGKFSTAANWNTDAVPVTGDVLTFGSLGSTGTVTLENDLAGVELGGVTYNTDGSFATHTTYVIDTLSFQDGAIITKGTAGGSQVNISGSVVAAGGLVFDGTTSPFLASGKDINVSFTNLTIQNSPMQCSGGGGGFEMTWKPTGTVNIGVDSSYLLPRDTQAQAVVVGAGGVLSLAYQASGTTTWDGDITFNGGGANQGDVCGTPDLYSISGGGWTLTGTITMNGGDIKYNVFDGKTLTVSGPINGPSYALIKATGSTGTFVNSSTSNNSKTLGGTQVVPVTTLPPATGDQPSTLLRVESKTIVSLDGARGAVTVNSSGVLKGTGTAQSLSVWSGGTVAPGHSPGTLTVLETFSLSGSYEAEVLNKDTYDQLVVGEDYAGGGSAVTLNTGSTLDLVLYEGWSIDKDDAFTIIDNKSSTAVSGTFDGLAEGAQFVVDGITFSISYIGGDGNDVVITALNTGSDPNAPDTSVTQSALSNPLSIVALGVVSAGIFAAAALRRRFNQ